MKIPSKEFLNMARPLKPHEVARAAAEGVAIALSARDATYRGPFHIICGYPANEELEKLFRVEFAADVGGVMRAQNVEEIQQER
jgi:hypothetical protein